MPVDLSSNRSKLRGKKYIQWKISTVRQAGLKNRMSFKNRKSVKYTNNHEKSCLWLSYFSLHKSKWTTELVVLRRQTSDFESTLSHETNGFRLRSQHRLSFRFDKERSGVYINTRWWSGPTNFRAATVLSFFLFLMYISFRRVPVCPGRWRIDISFSLLSILHCRFDNL
jgi:hypothetical protein